MSRKVIYSPRTYHIQFHRKEKTSKQTNSHINLTSVEFEKREKPHKNAIFLYCVKNEKSSAHLRPSKIQ